MTTSGLVPAPGQGRVLHSSTPRVTSKISGRRSSAGSLFEIEIPVGFDVGAHVHARSEEFFHVLDGEVDLFAFEPTERTGDNRREWRSAGEERVRRVDSGAVMHVPAGCPHAFANPGPSAARLLFQAYLQQEVP
jgi:mannose-6-phosphate isomerase-like protein (cupin superfamily)